MIDCTVTFTLQECYAISAALMAYGRKELGVKFPPEVTDDDRLFENFTIYTTSKRLEIVVELMDEIKRGMHKAILDARLEEMGHEDKESKK